MSEAQDFNSRAAGNWNDIATWMKKLTGTSAFVAGSNMVTGTGTSYTSELVVGDILMLQASTGTIRGTVSSITDNTHLILNANASGTASGAYGKEAIPSSANGVITITHAITVTANVTVDEVLYNTASTLTINSGVTLTIADGPGTDFDITGLPTLQVNGTLDINGTLTGFRTVNISSTGTVNVTNEFNLNTGNNVLVVDGILNVYGTLTGINTATINNGAVVNVSGIFNLPNGNPILTVNAGANLNFTGTANMTIASVTQVRMYGTLTMSGSSSLYTTRGNGGYTLQLYSGGTIDMSGTSSITVAGASTARMDILSGGTIKLGSQSTIVGAGQFRLCNGANIFIGSANGIASSASTGNILCASARTYGAVNDGGSAQGTNTTNYTYYGSASQVTGNGLPSSINNLTFNNAAGVTLTASVASNGLLTLGSGIVSTGIYTLQSTSTGTVSRTSGHVKGNFQKHIVTGATSKTFEIGDANNYTPLNIDFASVTTAGDLTASTAGLDHVNIGSSVINSSKTANRTWTLANSGILFTTFNANFTFVTGDLDISATPGNFIVGRYNSSWTYPSVGTKTSTSTQATALNAFGDFQLGEQCITATVANAGNNQTSSATCGLTTVTLAGNTPIVGTGAWSIVSGTGGTVTTPTSPTSTFTGTSGTTYVLRWTISNSPCAASTSDVTITFNAIPTANAGANQTSVATCGLTTITLAGNTPTVGTGVWSIVSGAGGTITSPTSPTSSFSGTAGSTYVLRWTITNSPCTSSSSDVTITFNINPTTATSQANPSAAATCGLTTIELTGNTPSVGTGVWSIISGTGGTVTTPTNPTSTFSGIAGNTYLLNWTISNSPCPASVAAVPITFNLNPTVANAGADQSVTAICGATLAANAPSVGTGAWSIISGAGGTVTSPSNPASTFYGIEGTTYTLRWTISNSPCTASADDVLISMLSPGTWMGTIDTTWNNNGNWVCGTIPTTLTNVTVPGALANYPVLKSGTGSVHNLTIQSGASLKVTDAVLQISGSISNSGTFNTGNGSIEFNGETEQVIPANYFANNTIKSLIITNNVKIEGIDTLTDVLTLTAGKTLTIQDNLILKSTENGTASIAALPVDINGVATAFINGKITVERFIPARRVWRLLGAPVSTTNAPTINASWQEGVTTASTNPNPHPGFGTHITGGTVANGFDQNSTNSASLKYFNPANNTLIGVPSTNVPITNYTGYFLFVRGDRSNNLSLGASAPATNTILRIKGQVATGNQTKIVNATNFTLIGNPYPSAIDFGTISKTNVANTIYIWDPKMGGSNGVGGYVAGSYNAGTSDYNFTSSISPISQYIPSGEAFFIIASSSDSAGSVTIKESDKTILGSDQVFGRVNNVPNPSVRINLYGVNANASTVLVDGTLATYFDGNNNGVDIDDAKKMINSGENVSLKRAGILLSIERRKMIGTSDTLFMNISQMKWQTYKFEISMEDLGDNIIALLKDRLPGSTLNDMPLNATGTTNVFFTVNSNASSYAADRFSIVFMPAAVVPVTIQNIKARQHAKDIVVSWHVENQLNIASYKVQSSLDGINFNSGNSITATNNSAADYNWIDKDVINGLHYYKLMATGIAGEKYYSSIVTVNVGASNDTNHFSILSNGNITNSLTIQVNAPQADYEISIISNNGQLIKKQILSHIGGSINYTIELPAGMAAGNYQFLISGKDMHYSLGFIKK